VENTQMAAAKIQDDKGDKIANHHAWGDDGGKNWRIEGMDDNPGVLLIPVSAYISAAWVLLKTIIWEVCATIFSASNIKFTQDRVGLTRSAIFLVFFMVIHAVGNLHVFLGPDDFNGYGYFYVRLYWTGFGLPANIVEEYVLLSALLHVLVALKRTWGKLGMGVMSGALNLAITGLLLLTFMTIHLFQFRFGACVDYMIRPPPYLINFAGILTLNLFWSFDDSVGAVPVRDIYGMEFNLFKGSPMWSAFYAVSVCIFMAHACLGWTKVLPVLGIPKGHHKKVDIIGKIIFFTLGFIYLSFVVYTNLTDPKGPAVGAAPQECTTGYTCDFVNPHTNVWA